MRFVWLFERAYYAKAFELLTSIALLRVIILFAFFYFSLCPLNFKLLKPAVPKLCAAKVCESCCTYCFSHNNCSVKVVSSNFPSENDSDFRTFFKQPDFGREIGKSEMKSK